MTAALHERMRKLVLGKVECPDLEPNPDGTPREKDLFARASDAVNFNKLRNQLYSTSVILRAYECSYCQGFHLTSKGSKDYIPRSPFSMPRQNHRRIWKGKKRDPKRRTRCRRKEK